MTLDLTPTLFLAWLSHPSDGGHFDPATRETDDHRGWRKHGPLHLSLHLRRESAVAALEAAALAEWDRAELSYAHGPRPDTGREALAYMTRHVGYDGHTSEQPVILP